jgi:ABC-type Fe3+ transport system substrate-binding protein
MTAVKKLAALFFSVAFASGAQAQSANWQKTWDETLAAARKEGHVVVLGSPDPVMRNEIIPKFIARYGISVSYIAGSSSQLVTRVGVERASGIYTVDVFMSGNDTTVNVLYPGKMIDPLKPLLILPDVVDGSKWKTGKLWFIDPEERYALRLFSTVTGMIFINTDHVKPEEMRSVQDLLNPKWKRKISTDDPMVNGSGANGAGNFYTQLGPEYVKKLFVGQEPLISRERRALADGLARGTYPICLTCRADDVRTLQDEGFHIVEIYELAGITNRIRPGPFLLTVANKAPNPNAARVFVNWMAGREALEIHSRNYGEATLRKDVDESFLNPHTLPRPGVSYPDDGDYNFILTGRREATDNARAVLKRP